MIFTVCAEIQPDELQTEPYSGSEDQETNHKSEVTAMKSSKLQELLESRELEFRLIVASELS